MSDYASEVASAIERLSDNGGHVAEGLIDIAGALCYLAANGYEGKTPGEKRELAAVMFHTAQKRFGGVKYDGRPIEKMEIAELDALWTKLTGGKPRR